MTNLVECDRSTRCLNFRLKARPNCNDCGVRVTMNHFHDNTAGYRICHDCFIRNFAAIEAGTYRPPSWIRAEVRVCENRERCFETEPYGIFRKKLCDECGKYPPEHYHDIEENIRLCLVCYRQRRGGPEA